MCVCVCKKWHSTYREDASNHEDYGPEDLGRCDDRDPGTSLQDDVEEDGEDQARRDEHKGAEQPEHLREVGHETADDHDQEHD